MERTLPTRQRILFGRKVSLNPGPFNAKEHMLITIMGMLVLIQTDFSQCLLHISLRRVDYHHTTTSFLLRSTMGV